MKKIFTLLFALGILTIADAQRGNRGNRGGNARVGVNISVNNNGFNQSRFAADRMLRQEIARINFKYDRKIHQVRNNFFMRHRVKMQKMRTLDLQRQREINRAYAKARINHNRYNSRRY